jgi:hypothetical protein
MKIVNIVPMPNFTLFIKSDSDITGYFDLRPYLDFEAFRPLQNADEFMKIHNGGYFIEWNCGADLSADTIFTKWQVTNSSTQYSA